MATINSYDLDDFARLGNHSGNSATAAFKDAAGVATDPTAVTLTVKKPDGTTTTYTYQGTPALLKESAGRFYVDVALDQEGRWKCRLKGTGAIIASHEWEFNVRESYF